MNFINADINKFSSLRSVVSFSEDHTVLLIKFSGKYGKGSEGNGDGALMFSVLAANYFGLEPITLVLDLRELDYSWGNTIIRSLNFFSETGRDEYETNKREIIIVSESNKTAILGILEFAKEGSRLICDSYDHAINEAKKHVTEYLE